MNLLRAAGYDVYAEYYVNDAGSQIAHLAESVNARYLQLLGKDADVPEDGYHGYDIVETAKSLIDREGDAYLSMDEEARLKVFKTVALNEKLSILKRIWPISMSLLTTGSLKITLPQAGGRRSRCAEKGRISV